MNTSETTRKVGEALERFERRLEVPVVPGEMAGWLEKVSKSAEAVNDQLKQEFLRQNQQTYETILRRDIALAARVKAMKAEDERLQQRSLELSRQFADLVRQCQSADFNETSLKPQVTELANSALLFIIDTRKQFAALKTWFLEAFNRDRGVAD